MPRRAPATGTRSPRREVGVARRAQIVEAAVAVIAEQGIQNLSLSAIEKKAGMARGHLTYYFPAKEKILLAVYDHLLALIYERIGAPRGEKPYAEEEVGSEWVRHLLALVLLRPPVSPEFHCLQYTFLSQIGHREDFRKRLASLYEEWRGNMANGIGRELVASPAPKTADPRLLASLVQALLHGLSMQLAADPQAFDREAMLGLCHEVLGDYLCPAEGPAQPRGTHATEQRSRSRRPKKRSARRPGRP